MLRTPRATRRLLKLMIDALHRRSDIQQWKPWKPGTAAPRNRFAERSPERTENACSAVDRPRAPPPQQQPTFRWVATNPPSTTGLGMGRSPPYDHQSTVVPSKKQVFRQGQDRWPLQALLQASNSQQHADARLILRLGCVHSISYALRETVQGIQATRTLLREVVCGRGRGYTGVGFASLR